MRRKNFFLYQVVPILVLYTFYVKSQETRWTVDEITTSTVSFTLNDDEEGAIELAREGGTRMTGVQNPDSRQWKFENLIQGTRYTILSNSRPTGSFITTASCPKGWTGFRHSCYRRVDEKRSRNDAQEYCGHDTPGISGHLADPRAIEEFQFITSPDFLKKELLLNWIGITLKGDKLYTDGSNVTDEIRELQEDQINAKENCVSISPYNSLLWKDAQCEISGNFICEYTGPQRPRDISIETTSSFADVKWEKPISLYGSQISSYTISVEGFEYDFGDKTSLNVTKYRVENLTPGHPYHAYVVTMDSDQKSGSYSIQFTTNPEGPQNLTVVRKDFSKIEVKWDNLIPEEHLSRFSVSNGIEMIYVGADTNQAVLRNLSPYIEYNITVFAVVEYYGLEKLSIPAENATILVKTDVSPVFDLHVIEGALKVTEFDIAWTPAIGMVDSYEITVSRYNEDDPEKIKFYKVESDQEMFQVRDLIPGENYIVTVTTKRLDGESNKVSLQQRPRPRQIDKNLVRIDGVTENTIDVTIIDLTGNSQSQSVFDKFILEFEKPNGEIRNVFLQKQILLTNDTIRNLTPGTTYGLKIYAESYGVRSFPVNLADVSMELSPPNNFMFLSRDETSIQLGWEPSEGDVSRYLVTCDGCPDEAKLVETDEGNFVNFLNLNPGMEYIFTIVSQITNKNNQPKTSKQVVTNVRTMPNNPGSVKVEYIDANTVTLLWEDVTETFTHFQVDYVAYDGQNSTVSPANGTVFPKSSSMATVGNLTNGITYLASVYTVSDDTFSKPSIAEIQLAPNPVAKIEIMEVGETWCNIGWEPGYGGYKQFHVFIDLLNGGTTTRVLLDTTFDLQYNATLPTAASLYNIRIFTISLSDVSSISKETFATTRPLAVTDVEIYAVTESSFQVRWYPPKSTHDSFIVLLDPETSSGQERSNTTKLSYETFTGLMPGTFYTVKIFSVYNKTKSYNVKENVTLYPEAPDNLTTAASSTTLTITWEKPRGEADSYIVEWEPKHGGHVVTGETAHLSQLTPGVLYKIDVYSKSAGNLKTSKTSAKIYVRTEESLPGTPTVITKTSPDTSSFTISWNETQHPNGIILGYKIKYKQIYPHYEDDFEYTNVGADANEAVVENLESGAWYEFYLNTANSKGEGNWTEREYIRIKSSSPGPVTELDARTIASYSLVISWKAPNRPNGDIIKYTLRANDSKNKKIEFVTFYRNEMVNHFECFDGDQNLLVDLPQELLPTENITKYELYFNGLCPVNFQLGSLKPYENYQIEVVAFTSIGSGTPKIIDKTTKEEVPSGPPQNVTVQKVGPTTITLKWSPPENPNGRVFYTVSFVDIESGIAKTTTNHTEYTISNLRPFSIYAVALTSGTIAGESESTYWLPLNTTEDEPGQPLNLTGEVKNSKSVNLNWQPPNDTRGVVTEYQVSIYDGAENGKLVRVDKVKPENIDKTVLPMFLNSDTNQNDKIDITLPIADYLNTTISTLLKRPQSTIKSNETVYHLAQQLLPYTTYEFQVRAVTSAGPGDPAFTVLKTAEDKPGSRPTNLQYFNLTSTSVNLTWSEPENPNGKIIAYDVIYLSDEQKLSHEVLDTTFAVLEDLKKYSPYSVYVNSKTSAGRGNASEVLIMHTDEDVPDSPPRNLQYLNVTPAVVEIKWDAPLIPNGVIQYYTVHFRNSTGEHHQESPTTSIYLENLKIYGEYWVHVSGSTKHGDGGQMSEILYIKTGEGEPGTPPNNLDYQNLNSTSINLLWETPLEPNGLILQYEITIKNDHENMSFVTPDDKTEYVIHGLKPYSAYSAYVRARTKHGDGGMTSDPLEIQTLEDAPSTSPTNIVYKNVSSTKVELFWKSPTVPNGMVESYTIYYRNKSATVLESNKSAIIAGLDPYTMYEFRLSARTKAGEGPNATITIYTDEDKPSSAPRVVNYAQNSSTAMTLSWLPPLKPNGVILSYEIQYGNDEKILQKTTNDTKITLSKLDKYSSYSGRIYASTKVGFGLKYLSIEFQTLEDAPSDPPHNVRATAKSSSEIEVSWESPNKPNGIIQFYTIYASQDNFPVKTFKAVNSTTWTIGDLQTYTFYDIYVSGSTFLGDGDQISSIVRVRTKEGVPDTPVNDLTAKSVNSTAIVVNWSAPVPPTGVFEYVVMVFKSKSNQLVYNNTYIDTHAFIGNLEAYTNYSVTVIPRVKNVDDHGPPSSIFTRTDEDIPSEPIENLTAQSTSFDSVVLTWDSSPKPNGLNRASIVGLQPNTYYKASVVPATIVGKGPPALIRFKTAEGVPEDKATDVKTLGIGSQSATLSWKPPSNPNGQITTYKIVYHIVNDKNIIIEDSEKSLFLKSPTPRHILLKLESYTNYAVVIYSGTSAGFGKQHSDVLYFTTLQGVPSAPELKCSAMDHEIIMLEWETPKTPNGIIESYDISYHADLSPSEITSDSVDKDADVYLATDLQPYTTYVFTISAFTESGEGEKMQCTAQTSEGEAEAPRKLRLTNSDSTSLALVWLEPPKMNGEFYHYELFYQPPDSCWRNGNINQDEDEQIKWCTVKTRSSNVTLSYLNNYSKYNISVAAFNGLGLGAESRVQSFKTKVGEPPFPPRKVKAKELSSTSITVSWTEPLKLGGPTTYQVVVTLYDELVTTSTILASNVRNTTVMNLEEDVRYNVTVLAITSAGSVPSKKVYVRTDEDAPGDYPAELRIKTIPGNSTALRLEFLPPTDPNGAIYEYNIQYKLEDNNDTTTIHVYDEDLPLNGSVFNYHWFEVTGLLGGRSYYFRLNAATQAPMGVGPYSPWTGPTITPTTVPPKPNVSVEVASPSPDSRTGQTVLKVDICVFSDINGPLARIMVIIAEDGADLMQNPLQWLSAHILNPVPPYMVLATTTPSVFCDSDGSSRKKRSVGDDTFAVGQDDTCAETKKPYCNGPLKSNTPYRFKIRGETPDGNATETEFSDPVKTLPTFLEENLSLIIGLAIGIFVFVLFVSILVIVLRRKYAHRLLDESQRSNPSPNKRTTDTETPMPTSAHNMSFVLEPTNKPGNKAITRPVEKSQFVEHVSRMSEHNDKGFSSEFEEIESVTPYGPKTIGSLPCNSNKNRFAEIIPYDLYRVKIESKTEGSGYINASYIPGPETPEQYIATQSPLSHTKSDFWKMLWETGAQRIIMLCNTDQNGNDNCTKYWPSLSQTVYFGNLAVQSMEEDRMPEWTVRKFQIAKRDKRRQVTQYHFTMWPVRSVPDNPRPLVRFLRTVRADNAQTKTNNPTVVMCSSGSGRTAVFIALDSIVDGLARDTHIDACGVVADLRNCRPNMIQTATEYSFLHRCLAFILLDKSTGRTSVRSPTGDGVEETTMF